MRPPPPLPSGVVAVRPSEPADRFGLPRRPSSSTGITAGYHRLWAHRSYTASLPLQYFLALGGSGAVEGASLSSLSSSVDVLERRLTSLVPRTGSIKWWSRGHRAHHRYTDTDLDPYSAQKGFWWSHIGWMIVKPRRTPGVADVSDLSVNEVVKWQHRWYVYLIVGMGFVFPTLVAGLGWGDYRGGFFFAGAARLLFVHHVRPRSPPPSLLLDLERVPDSLPPLPPLAVDLLRQLARPLAR